MSDEPADKPPYFGVPGFSDSYWFELLFDKPTSLDVEALVEKASSDMPVEIMVKAIEGKSGTISLGYPDRLINVDDVKMPVMTNLVWSDGLIKLGDYKAALDQTWDWEGAKKALGRCFYKMIVGDITGSRLQYAERLRRLTTLVTACIEVTNPHVVFWKEAGCLVEPSRFAERAHRACNVRMFEVGISGDHLMDTLGLAAIGLPDLEVRFRGLDTEAVAGFLYATAKYLYERGDIINDGDTVPGPADTKWKAEHDAASVAPPRTVIRVTPDARYAGSATR